jgi:hypothetical protein
MRQQVAFGCVCSISTTTATTLLTEQFAQHALAGTVPNEGVQTLGSTVPTDTCLGSANMPVQ